jgi:hypothetical protein
MFRAGYLGRGHGDAVSVPVPGEAVMHRAWVALTAGVIVSGAVLTGMAIVGRVRPPSMGDPDLVETGGESVPVGGWPGQP